MLIESLIPIRYMKLSENAHEPTRGSKYAAGWDMYAAGDYEIAPSRCVKVPTDIAIECPEGFFAGLFPRSGLSTKQGLRLSNCVGVIDADFRGGIVAAIYNDSDEIQYINKGDRIAQLIIIPYCTNPLMEYTELSDTERGSGSFGSTGTN